MLDAFAQRLEQEEANGPIIGYVSREIVDRAEPRDWLVLPVYQAPQTYAGQMTETGFTPAEQMREEGRREILQQIATVNPLRWDDNQRMACVYCGFGQLAPHAPSCVWLLAQEAAK